MIKATINGKTEFSVEQNKLNGEAVEWDIADIGHNSFHILKGDKSYTATVISFNAEEKTMVININGNDYEISIKDKYDLLLQQLGISSKSSSAVQSIKAPMPGLIINVMVKEGDQVNKGDALLILEAMKMENVLKSPRDGVVKNIKAQLRQAVEKNQVLLEFQ